MSAALPARSRGTIALAEQTCTSCMVCVRDCPDWCIYIESHTEVLPGATGRARTRPVLDRFAIDFGLCMYCGICIEVCPFDALFWSPDPTPPSTGLAALTQERDLLGDALRAVPPPPRLEPGTPPG